MTTFKAEITKSERKKDGTWCVKIRITHRRKTRRYSTQMFATEKDITKGGKIKNQAILDSAEDIIRGWRKKLVDIGITADTMDVDAVVRMLTSMPQDEQIPMFPWMRAYAEKIPKPNTRINYTTAINSLERYIGFDISFQQLRTSMLRGFLESKGGSAATNLIYIKKMFREAMLQYNEDDIVRIPNDPFARIVLTIPKSERKRGLSVDVVRMIANMPDVDHVASVRNFARDMFVLSFVTIGTNAVDLYHAELPADGVFAYERRKVMDKRKDRGYISINLHPVALALIERHKGVGKMLNLSKRYAQELNMHKSLRMGFLQVKQYLIDEYRRTHATRMSDDEIVKTLGIGRLSYYSARHSWATIARNDVGIDKWTVHEALNHVDKATSITDIYIRRDFTRINEANLKVIEYVFGDYFALLQNQDITHNA